MHSMLSSTEGVEGPLDLSIKNVPNNTNLRPVEETNPLMTTQRPFKAVTKRGRSSDSPHEVNMLLLNPNTTEDDDLKKLLEEFEEKRVKYLEKMSGHLMHSGSNQNMRRTQNNQEKNTDPEYIEKRKKNNESAKKSRDARRQKQDELAITAGFLELECVQLKCRIQALSDELAYLP